MERFHTCLFVLSATCRKPSQSKHMSVIFKIPWVYSWFVNSFVDLLQHHITGALSTSWATIPTTVQHPAIMTLVSSQRNHAWHFLVNQKCQLKWTGAKILRNSHIFPSGHIGKKEDGDLLPLLNGCCRRSLFPEKGFPILRMRVMLSFGATIGLFLLSVPAPRIVPLMESFYIFLSLAMLFYFLLESQEFLMTFVTLEYLSEPKFCSAIKKDWFPFTVLF